MLTPLSSDIGHFIIGRSPIGGVTIGSQPDFLRRIFSVLPQRWFPDNPPVVIAVLNGLANAWAALYALLQFVVIQARIITATDVFLDIISQDFFGSTLARNGRSDTAFRAAILPRLLQRGGTRQGMAAVLTMLTGTAPTIIDPWRPSDCGAWGGGPVAFGYSGSGSAGGGYWGTRKPAQSFVKVTPGSAAAADVYATAAAIAPAGISVWVSNA